MIQHTTITSINQLKQRVFQQPVRGGYPNVRLGGECSIAGPPSVWPVWPGVEWCAFRRWGCMGQWPGDRQQCRCEENDCYDAGSCSRFRERCGWSLSARGRSGYGDILLAVDRTESLVWSRGRCCLCRICAKWVQDQLVLSEFIRNHMKTASFCGTSRFAVMPSMAISCRNTPWRIPSSPPFCACCCGCVAAGCGCSPGGLR